MSARARRFFGCLLPLILAIFGCGSLALLGYASQIAIQVLTVRDASMDPVLEPGWRVLINNTAFWAREPELGAIVSMGGAHGQTFRRLYAFPGQTIEGRAGNVYVDGAPSSVLDHAHGDMPDFGPLTLEPDQYFLLAEDRSFDDCRKWGPVARDRLYGSALLYFPQGTTKAFPVDPTPTPTSKRPRRSGP